MILPLSLIVLGLIMPSIVTVHDFAIIPLVHKAILAGDSGHLLMASARLVFLNTLRALPHYLGVFLLAEFLMQRASGNKRWLVLLGSLALIPLVYITIELLYDIRYDFGGPALMALLGITILHQLFDYHPGLFNKTIILILVLAAVQCLDVVPALTPYGFGRGEISLSIKAAATFLDAEAILFLLGMTFFITCGFSALALGQLLMYYNKELILIEQARRQEEALHTAHLQALNSRAAVEIQSLVHDLKTPLTSIQGLSGVIQLKNKNGKIAEYAHRIEQCVDQMSEMIGEILHEHKQRYIPPASLIKYTLSHLSSHPKIEAVKISIEDGLPHLLANRIRLTRALVNFIDNALEAISTPQGKVEVQVKRAGSQVAIIIRDNGPGIAPEDLNRIWDVSFSTKNSLGLGLPFARGVIVDHGGKVFYESKPNEGCSVKILLPGGDEYAQQATNSSSG
ncbi:MAG: HAMP domain-containing histidine kinase [Firmicutes bacterium]|nr:HAMP domain-containing histidine kinase [Bacillota bacterium]